MLALLAALVASPVSTEVTLPAEPAPLVGTLVTPDGPAKAAVFFVPNPEGGTADGGDGYIGSDKAALANGLLEHGIASIRYAARDLIDEEMSFESYGRDIVPWAELLAARTGQQCVWLASYQGSTAITHTQVKDNPKVCGMLAFSPDTSHPVDSLVAMHDSFTTYLDDFKEEIYAFNKETIAGLEQLILDSSDEKEREALGEYLSIIKSKQAEY